MKRFALAMFVLALHGVAAKASPPPMPVPRTYCERCERGQNQLQELPDSDIGAIRHLLETLTQPPAAAGLVLAPDDRAALDRFIVAFGEESLGNLAAYACHTDATLCSSELTRVLGCVHSQACPIQYVEVTPEPELTTFDSTYPGTCDPYMVHLHSPRLGVGVEVATGWIDSASPNEHRAWGLGLEVRRRLAKRFGVVGRVDYSRGRDAGVDGNGDGRDDRATGTVSRLTGLGGAAFLFADAVNNGVVRYLELDLLGGYTWMLSPADETGPVAGVDASYQLGPVRAGVRALQGFGDAQDARAVLAHVGIVVGGAPSYSFGGGCPGVGRDDPKSRPIGLALDLPLSGYGLRGPRYLAPGFGFEGVYLLTPHVQLVGRGDLLVFPNGDADHVLHQSLLGGLRVDFSPKNVRTGFRNGPFIALLGGYSWASVTRPSSLDSGAVLDASVGYLSQADDGGMWLRLHGRFGLAAGNEDLRAIFLSVGFELHLDRRAWQY